LLTVQTVHELISFCRWEALQGTERPMATSTSGRSIGSNPDTSGRVIACLQSREAFPGMVQ
ncbi:MAG: hypothetical protein SFW36_05770, partial [Leptolyngbyaceae cyanobacterium bins.59]|nr:hypothetical protein [Leptolyngbyaceae cyanobacterium bins.59]